MISDATAAETALLGAVQQLDVGACSGGDVRKADLAREGVIPTLVALLDRCSSPSDGAVMPALREAVVHTLRTLSCNNPLAGTVVRTAYDNSTATIQAGAAPVLVAVLRDDRATDALKESACACLCQLASTAANRVALLEAGAVAPLVALVKQVGAGEKPRMQAALALGSLAFRHAPSQEAIDKAGGVAALEALANDGTPTQWRVATYAVRNIKNEVEASAATPA